MSACGFVLRHRLERDRRPDVAARPIEQGPEKRLGGRFLAAEGQHREHGGRARRPKQLLEQDGAVRVGPLQVVDPDDERRRCRQPAQQLAQRRERPPPETQGDRRSRAPDREQASATASTCNSTGNTRVSAGTSGGISRSTSLAWNRPEVAAQVVDDPVERLVRHGLVLVAAAGEHDDIVARADWLRKRRTSALLPMPDGP